MIITERFKFCVYPKKKIGILYNDVSSINSNKYKQYRIKDLFDGATKCY